MELRQLQYLEAVLETGTFTAAAVRCRVAQPALWAQVRALERSWGVALFERAGRRVRPTDAALALRPHLRVLLGDAAALAAEAERLRTGASGVVRIGTTHYHVTYFLAEAIARHARRHPALPLPIVVPIGSADPYGVLAEGAVDLVTGSDPAAHGFEGAPLYEVWLAAAGPAARPPRMDVAALAGAPLAALGRAFASRVLLEQACARAGVVPRIVFEDVHAESLLALSRSGLATSIVVNEALPARPGLPVARLTRAGRPLAVELSLMWRSEATLSAAARLLRDSIVALAAERRRAARAGSPPGRTTAGGRRAHAGAVQRRRSEARGR